MGRWLSGWIDSWKVYVQHSIHFGPVLSHTEDGIGCGRALKTSGINFYFSHCFLLNVNFLFVKPTGKCSSLDNSVKSVNSRWQNDLKITKPKSLSCLGLIEGISIWELFLKSFSPASRALYPECGSILSSHLPHFHFLADLLKRHSGSKDLA